MTQFKDLEEFKVLDFFNSEDSLDIILNLKINIYDKDHNLLYDFIINNLEEFKLKRYYFNIVENDKEINPELIIKDRKILDFQQISEYLLNVLNNKTFITDNKYSEIDLSLPDKDLIFNLS